MTRAPAIAAAAIALAAAAPARADDPRDVDLRIRRLPGRVRLAMRVAQAPAPAATAAPRPARPATATPPRLTDDLLAPRGGARVGARAVRDDTPPLADRLVVRIDLGLAVDGARPSGDPSLDGHTPVAAPDRGAYRSVRTYGFGEVYLGSRGVGAPGLSTYFASQIRAATEVVSADLQPIMSPYDSAADLQARSAWIETDDLFDQVWLRPLRVRAGRQFLYGPAIVHADALLVAWEHPAVQITAWAGTRVPDYRIFEDDTAGAGETFDRRGAVSGAELRADLRRWSLPVVVGVATLGHREHDHRELTATLLPHRDVVVRSATRFMDRDLARQRLVVRARVSEDSTVILDGQVRTRHDWFWDYSGVAVDATATGATLDASARRYLDLGPVRPRLQGSIQAGTVLFQNVDLLARAAFAADIEQDEDELNPHLPRYVEGGAGIEVRLRRTLALQATALLRDYALPFPQPIRDLPRDQVPTGAQLLPDRDRLGEESLVEGGVAVRYTTGARKLSAHAEIYGRRSTWAAVYLDADGAPLTFEETHGGGRFWVDAWVSPRIRLRTEYDLSTTLDVAPEIRGVKTLRLLIEGTY